MGTGLLSGVGKHLISGDAGQVPGMQPSQMVSTNGAVPVFPSVCFVLLNLTDSQGSGFHLKVHSSHGRALQKMPIGYTTYKLTLF